MLIDARSVARDATFETDVCVVGAGAAGLTLALEFAEQPFRVALLESGGFEPEEDTQALYRGRVFGRSYLTLDSARTRRFGGSTHCWHGFCRPLDPIDFETRDWVPHSGWPFGADALRPFYERAQRTCRLEEFDYDGSHWESDERPALPFEGDSIVTRVFQISPLRFGEFYRSRVVSAEKIDTYLHANVFEIRANASGKAVEEVRVATLDGNAFSVRARLFILATGGIENARLLLASNAVQRAGLGNDHDLVGRYFMEHPHVVAGALLPSSAGTSLGLYHSHRVGRVEVLGLLTASDAARRRERILGFASFVAEGSTLPEFERALAVTIGETDGRPGGPAETAVFFMNECEQAPNPESRVRLVDERDALGMPRVQLEWRLSAIDKRSLRRGHELLALAFGRAGLGRLQLMLSEEDHTWPPEMGGGRHHLGTTRMHDDPRRGVVDASCRVHGVDNLYVAGSSVFPTGGAADPTLTLVALAIRLADHVKERLR